MPEIRASIALNLDAGLIQAAYPLLESGLVDGLEWSFDALYAHPDIPDAFAEILHMFGQEGRLVGHGVFFSLLSGKWLPEQAQWLTLLRALSQRFQFDHISEHFGFFSGSDFHQGAPLSVPLNADTLAIGQDRLLRIAEACGCPVGLENLAFAPNAEAARIHGAFLEQLVAPANGFLILDLHNLYCQSCNFGMEAERLLDSFPLHRVREVHISGGSWEPSPFRPAPGVRRDTHDGGVPEAVFELLAAALPRLTHLRFVVLEYIGTALHTEAHFETYRADFLRMREVVAQENARRQAAGPNVSPFAFLPNLPISLPPPLERLGLHAQQRELAQILESAATHAAAEAALQRSSLANSDWDIEHWDPAMLETARRIAQKWKDGFYV